MMGNSGNQNSLNVESSESSSSVSTGKSEWLHLCGAGYVPESQDTMRAIEWQYLPCSLPVFVSDGGRLGAST